MMTPKITFDVYELVNIVYQLITKRMTMLNKKTATNAIINNFF